MILKVHVALLKKKRKQPKSNTPRFLHGKPSNAQGKLMVTSPVTSSMNNIWGYSLFSHNL